MSQGKDVDIKGTAEKMLANKKERERLEAVAIENQEEYKRALNIIAGSDNGIIVFKTLIKACGVFKSTKGLDGMQLVEANALKNLYLELFRPYLTPELKQELEI